MPLDVLFYEEFIKPNCLNGKIGTGVPSWYLRDPFQKFLKVIRKYFTYERRSDRIYPHHIIFLMHFTGKSSLNLPLFLHQSLRGMVDNVQSEANKPKKKLSHISLIKLFIVEELRRLGKHWDSFFFFSRHPQGPQTRSPSTHRRSNIS
jgi:hypothetical protein